MKKIPNDQPWLLSIPKAATLLGVDRKTVLMMLNDPALPRLTVGRSEQIRIPRDMLLAYLRHTSTNWFGRVK